MSKITLFPKQTRAMEILEDKTTTELLFGGAAGGSKSFLGAYWLIKVSNKYPGTRWVMGRKELKTLKETTLVSFFEVCRILGLKGNKKDFFYNGKDDKVIWNNGSQIILKDLKTNPSDPIFDSLGSLEITGAFIDEANQVSVVARDILMSRIRWKLDENDLIPKLLMTCNPAKNWVYNDYYKPAKEQTLKPYRKFLQAYYYDNPKLSKHYIQNLRKLPEVSKERLLKGNWEFDNDPARLIDFNKIADLFTNSFVEDPAEQRFMTADIALYGSDKFVIVIWIGWTAIKIFDFAKTEGNEVENKIKQYAEEYKIPRSNIAYDSDGLGGFLRGYLDCAIPFVNNSKAVKTGTDEDYQEEYKNLKTQCSFHFAAQVQSNKVYIKDVSAVQRDLIQDELGYIKRDKIDSDGKLSLLPKDKIKQDLGRSPDFSDALMMRSWFDVARLKTREVVGDVSDDKIAFDAEQYHDVDYGDTDGY